MYLKHQSTCKEKYSRSPDRSGFCGHWASI